MGQEAGEPLGTLDGLAVQTHEQEGEQRHKEQAAGEGVVEGQVAGGARQRDAQQAKRRQQR